EDRRRRCGGDRRTEGLRKRPPDTGRAVQGGSVMARKDKGADEEAAAPLVSTGTAGEGLDDLGAPIADEHDASEDETGQASTDADSAGAAEADAAAAAKSESAKADATAGLDDVPFELAEDPPDPDELPETGLVSEFVDVGNRQASWLVSN